MSLDFSIPPGIPEPDPNPNIPSDNHDNKRYCYMCLRKNPPVHTELILGTNWTKHRKSVGYYICTECENQRQRDYNINKQGQYNEYRQQLHDETCELLVQQWDDIAYRKLPFADRLYKVWNKYNRRSPEKGIRKAWILEVVLPNMWNLDVSQLVEDLLSETGWNITKKNTAKPYLIQTLANKVEFFQASYRVKAVNIFTGAIDTILKKYGSRDKMVADPKYIDPVTKEYIPNWFLLSREQEREIREQTREMKKERMDIITEEERKIIEGLTKEQKVEGGETK